MKRVEIRQLREVGGETLKAMTFPVYEPFLSLESRPTHPEQGDEVPVQPLVYVASHEGEDVGLALAARPLDGSADSLGKLLSVFVAKAWRHQGIGSALVASVEAGACHEGLAGLEAIYTTGKPSIPFLESILAARSWSRPAGRTLSVRLTPAAGFASGLLDPRRLAHQAEGLEIVSWSQIPRAEKEALRRSQENEPWIAPLLAPWRFDEHGYDASSVGARYQGKIVGWVITHQISPTTVRLTCSFIRRDLSRYGKILPLYAAVLRQLLHRCRFCTFVTPFSYPSMIAFIRRRLVPISEFVGETRECRLIFQAGKS